MNKRILFINHCSATSVVPQIVAQAGYSVDITLNSKSALVKPGMPNYSLIILLESPYAETWAVCADIRTYTSVPIIVISANASPETCVKTIAAGADYFIRKPFGPMELLARVNSLLQRVPSQVLMPLTS